MGEEEKMKELHLEELKEKDNIINSLSSALQNFDNKNKKMKRKCKNLIHQIKALHKYVIMFKQQKEEQYERLFAESNEEKEKFLKDSDKVFDKVFRKNEEKYKALLSEKEEKYEALLKEKDEEHEDLLAKQKKNFTKLLQEKESNHEILLIKEKVNGSKLLKEKEEDFQKYRKKRKRNENLLKETHSQMEELRSTIQKYADDTDKLQKSEKRNDFLSAELTKSKVSIGLLKMEAKASNHKIKKIRTDLQDTIGDAIQKHIEGELESKNKMSNIEVQVLKFIEALNDKDCRIKALEEKNKILEDKVTQAKEQSIRLSSFL